MEGQALIYIHKERDLDDVEQRYLAHHYALVDDKLRILTAVKQAWGDRVIRVVGVVPLLREDRGAGVGESLKPGQAMWLSSSREAQTLRARIASLEAPKLTPQKPEQCDHLVERSPGIPRMAVVTRGFSSADPRLPCRGAWPRARSRCPRGLATLGSLPWLPRRVA